MELDQKFRLLSYETRTWKKKRIANKYHLSLTNFETDLMNLQNKIDSSNLTFIEKILKTYGYPGVDLAGKRTNKVAWYVIQHSDKISIYLDIMRDAAKKNQLSKGLVAMMEDRQLLYEGKEQVYGTQGYCLPPVDGKSECIIWPIRNPENVNILRREFGFKETVEEYAKRLKIEYRIVTLEEIQKIKNDTPTGSISN